MEKKEEKLIIQQNEVSAEFKKVDSFGYLKPIGKVLGNNFFTFHRPNLEELFNTINSFPEPKYWLTSENFLIHPWMKNITNTNVHILSSEKIEGKVPSITWNQLSDFFHEISNQKAMVIISLNQEDELQYAAHLTQMIEEIKG